MNTWTKTKAVAVVAAEESPLTPTASRKCWAATATTDNRKRTRKAPTPTRTPLKKPDPAAKAIPRSRGPDAASRETIRKNNLKRTRPKRSSSWKSMAKRSRYRRTRPKTAICVSRTTRRRPSASPKSVRIGPARPRQAAEVQQFSQEIGQLTNIDAAIKPSTRLSTGQGLRESDPMSYSTHMADFNDLRARRGDMVARHQQKQQALTAAQRSRTFASSRRRRSAHGDGGSRLRQGTHRRNARYGRSSASPPTSWPTCRQAHAWKCCGRPRSSTSSRHHAAGDQEGVGPAYQGSEGRAGRQTLQPSCNFEKQTRRLQQTGSVKDLAALLSMTR
jgi:hypothetical protein